MKGRKSKSKSGAIKTVDDLRRNSGSGFSMRKSGNRKTARDS